MKPTQENETSATAPHSIRGLWAWPLGSLLIGGLEVARSSERIGGAPVSIGLALLAAFGCGVWVGALWQLAAILPGRLPLVARARERLHDSSARADLAAASGAVLVVTALGFSAIDVVIRVAEAHPVDYRETATRLWQGGFLLVGPIGVLVGLLAFAALARRKLLQTHARLVLRVTATGTLLLVVAHFTRGPFFIYFGAPVALLLLAWSAATAWLWLPRVLAPGRRKALAVLPIVLGALAPLGLSHPGARALLLHDSHVMPHLVDLGFGWLDRDGDGDLPPWMGGGDCDDGDPTRAGLLLEIAGNGIDDDCTLGDAEPASRAAWRPESPSSRPFVLLVTIDTLRPDRLELYGASRSTMPALADLGARGLVFERAYAPGNHTFYSITALLSGQSTERMLVPGSGQLRYTTWLPDLLRKLGYRTVAFNPPLVVDGRLDASNLRFDAIVGGGFDYAGKNRGTTAKQVADTVLAFIEGDRDPAPLAMWVHFMDPHAVHESPVRFPVSGLADAYDNELSWVDLHLGRILAAVDRTYGDSAIVIVTSDHGEELGEIGNYGHGFTLRETEIRVPLIISAPSLDAHRRSDPVSILGIAPTVLEMLGQPAHPAMSSGSLLQPRTDDLVVSTAPAFLWNEPRLELALVENEYKLLLSRTTNTVLLFDLARDPAERENLAARDPERVSRMRERLDHWVHLERAAARSDLPATPTP